MKYSSLFGNNTLRHSSGKAKAASFSLLHRGGYIRSVGPGLFAMMPLGMRVMDKLKGVIREELENLGGQEIEIPLVVPQNLWKKTGRDQLIGRELIRFSDRTGHNLVLSTSHLEPITQIARMAINSYRDVPRFLYQFQTKYRDEEKVKNGLFRAKEFVMNDAYSFHRSYVDLNIFFPKVFKAYEKIFERCQVPFVTAESAVGSLSGDRAYEFLMPSEIGDDRVITCPSCGYTANRDIAVGKKSIINEIPVMSSEINSPQYAGVHDLARALKIPLPRIAVTSLYKTLKDWVLVTYRADYEISNEKLSRFLEEPVIGPATQEEVASFGLQPGFLFPSAEITGFRHVVDDLVAQSANLVVGADKPGKHIVNANFGRDFESELIGDIVSIHAKDLCTQCETPMKEFAALEVGNVFKLGDFYSKSIGLSFTEENGGVGYPHMGSYGIGLGRLMGAVVEANHDEQGIIWPMELTPYCFYLMGIGKSLRVKKVVDSLAEDLGSMVLFDDRHESIGVKFKDFDLLGIPYRIVISTKSLEDGNAEFYERKTRKTWRVPVGDVYSECTKLINSDF